MKNFIGQDGFVWWIGIVEDINDPLTLGRCKVRCFGYHPAKSTNLVPTEDLPWSLTIHPLNTPNLYGTPKAGDWVFGFFLDSMSAQEPAILGYLPAIPEAAAEYFGTAPNMTRNFSNVTEKDSIVWDINGAKISLVNNTLLLHGKTELGFSDDVNNTTLAEMLDTSNTVYAQANSAFTRANSAFTQANSAFTQANTAISLAQTAYAQANTSTVLAQTAQAAAVAPINDRVIGAITPSDGTFTDVSVTTATGESSFNENDTITGWIYSGNSFSVAGQETSPTGLFFKYDGTKMYVCGSSGDDVNEYALSTAWDITTATFVTVFSVAAQDTGPQDIFFKPDGLTMFFVGSTNDTVFQYTLSTAWDISTASYASKSFSVASQDTGPIGIWFKPDGLVMYIVGSGNDIIFQYTLSTAWDITTASYASIFYNFAPQDSSGTQVNLSSDGTKMWLAGSTGDDILEYNLSTAWNVSTATVVNKLYVGFQEATPQSIFIDDTAPNRVYLMGSSSDAIYQYYTSANSLKLDTEKLYINGDLSANGNFVVGGSAYVDGNLIAQGSITVGNFTGNQITTSTSAITLGASISTGNTTITSSQSSGSIIIGGTSATGPIILGQSTAAQTLNLATGATATATTKTVNIGTSGVSGSTTAINIGSAVSGANSTTTFNGFVIDSISAAVSAAGATQATATALVSNINNVTVVASAADGVRLPTAVAGMRILVRNSDSADILKIYPATGAQINALGANTATTLAISTSVQLFATSTTQWYSV